MGGRPSRAEMTFTGPSTPEQGFSKLPCSTPGGEAAIRLNYEAAMAQYRLGKLLKEPTLEDARRWTPGAEGFTEVFE
jgi:hypothetical protein